MFKVAICCDANKNEDYLALLFLRICKKILLGVEIFRYNDSEKFLWQIENGTNFDFAYINIQSDIKDSLRFIIRLRQAEKEMPILFATEYVEQIQKVYGVCPIIFMRKPLPRKALMKLIGDMKSELGLSDYFFEYEYNRRCYRIHIDDILFFESNARNIVIHRKDGTCEFFCGKLDCVEEMLIRDNLGFIRIHQSYLVSYHAIRKTCMDGVVLMDGSFLPISKSKHAHFKETYQVYRNRKM